MRRQVIQAKATAAASPEVVYQLLRDGATWPQWSPIDSLELERTAPDEPEGVGAIRLLRTGRYTMREEIVELVPARRFSYELLAGLPVREYRADVELEPREQGTAITWTASFYPRFPGTGWLIRRRLQGIFERFVRGLAEHAAEVERSAGTR